MSATPKSKANADNEAVAVMGDLIAKYADRSREDLSLMDVMSLAEGMADTMHGFFDTLDATLYKEFREIGSSIAEMRTEIGALRPNDIKNGRIPDAGHELEAIVETTESATETIMTSVEAIMAADTKDADTYQAEVNDQAIKIMEACSFQDLTGQRISRVIETLTFIETRISRFSNAIGAMDGDVELTEEELLEAKRREDLILNGPQDEKDAIQQGAIDDMFG
jgi:chemotaxis protein CheZ